MPTIVTASPLPTPSSSKQHAIDAGNSPAIATASPVKLRPEHAALALWRLPEAIDPGEGRTLFAAQSPRRLDASTAKPKPAKPIAAPQATDEATS